MARKRQWRRACSTLSRFEERSRKDATYFYAAYVRNVCISFVTKGYRICNQVTNQPQCVKAARRPKVEHPHQKQSHVLMQTQRAYFVFIFVY